MHAVTRNQGFVPATLLTLGFGYFALASISTLLSGAGGAIVWLASAFAVVLTTTLRLPLSSALAVVAVSAAGAIFMFGATVNEAVVIAALRMFEVGVAVGMLRWWLGRDAARPATPGSVLSYLVVAAVVVPAAAAALAAALFYATQGLTVADTFVAWLGGGVLGAMLIVPPVIMALARNSDSEFSRTQIALLAVSAAGVLVCSALALWWHVYPYFLIGLCLLATTAFLGRLEVALLASAAGLLATFNALLGIVPASEYALVLFGDRFQLPLATSLVLPIFVSVLIWRVRLQQRDLRQSEALFRAALEDSATGMAIVELNGRISKANQALADMLGYSLEELLDKTFFELSYPDDRHIGLGMIRDIVDGNDTTFRFEKRYVTKDGTAIWMDMSCSVIKDDITGEPRFTVAQFANVDERINAQQAVVEAENRWNFALNSARQGVWDMNLREGKTYYSPMWKELLGYEDHELDNDPELWLRMIHPEDRERALNLDKDHLEGRTPFFEAEFRMRCKDGSWIWVLDRGKTVERDEYGRVVRAIGTHTDITALKQAQTRLAETARALKAEKERLRGTLHSIGDAVICTDADGHITFVNAAAEALTGQPADSAIGRPLSTIYCPRDEETNERISIEAEMAGGSPRSHNRAVIVRPDGKRSSIRQVVSPIITEGEVMNGSVIVFQDVTDARTLQRQLAYAATHDSLTGLANRANFHTTMRELVEETKADEKIEHQLLFVDLDRFKHVNDTGGHGAGDALLKKIAASLQEAVRRTDFVARLGGDEFALVLKYCNVDTAVRHAEEIVSVVSRIAFEWEGEIFTVGASIGITPINHQAGVVDEIVANADRGCYDAKSAGRGTVSVVEPKAA